MPHPDLTAGWCNVMRTKADRLLLCCRPLSDDVAAQVDADTQAEQPAVEDALAQTSPISAEATDQAVPDLTDLIPGKLHLRFCRVLLWLCSISTMLRASEMARKFQ